MKVREFLKTDEFKKADMIDYLYEDGSEYNGSHAELMKHEIINMIIFEL